MAAPTKAQQIVLVKMRGYRVISQLTTGEVIVAPDREYQFSKVIDINGHVYSYNRFMSLRNQRPASYATAS